MTPQWFHDSVERGYCLPEEDYNVEGGGERKEGGNEAKAVEEEGVWERRLEEFCVPAISDGYFLDGCRVSRVAGGTRLHVLVLV